jgi:hypothetical protein
MNVGDIIRFKDEGLKYTTGVLISYGNFSEGWWDILVEPGRMIVWPESQLELVA